MSVLSDMFYKHTVFHQTKTAHWKNFDRNIYFCQKCELISYKGIDYKHNIYFYTVQCKIYTRSACFLFSLLLKGFFLRGSILQYSNDPYLCFLAIFFLSLLSILHEHNIKCISYCSLWQFNLLCVILQISSTNLSPFLLLTISFSSFLFFRY